MKIQRCLILFFVAAALATAQTKNSEAALGAARNLEEAEGNYPKAIEAYKKIVAQAGKDRALAAKALVRMGQAYEKLGDAEARKTYERVVREFGDQKEAVADARKFLAAKGGAAESGGVVRQASELHQRNRRFGPALSRDGRYIAFVNSGRGLGVYEFATGEARMLPSQVTPGEQLSGPLISPDGKSIAYFKSGSPDTTGLYIIGVDGSNPRRLAGGKDLDAVPWGWSPDGKQVLAGFYSEGKDPQAALVSAQDGSSRIVASRASAGRISPDGRHIALVRFASDREVVLIGVEGGKESLVVSGPYSQPVWAPDGRRLLLISSRDGDQDLWSIRIEDGAAAGPPEFVQKNVPILLGATPNGEYYFNVRTDLMDLYMADADPQTGSLRSQPKQITTQGFNQGAAWSPDGEQLAYYSSGKVMIRSGTSGEVRELPLKERLATASRLPVWFPDSRTLLVHSYDGKLRRLDAQTGEFRPLPEEAKVAPYSSTPNITAGGITVLLSPDGRSIYYLRRDREDVLFLRRALEGGPETEVTRIAAASINGFSVSPDGNRLVFATGATAAVPGTSGSIWTAPTSGGPPKEFYRVATPNGYPHHPVWSKDGRRLLVALGGSGDDVYAFPGEGGGEPKPLGLGLHEKSCISIRPDGTQIVFADEQWLNYLWTLKNLFGEVKRAQ